MDTVELTKSLIRVPSYVDAQTNEKNVGDFLVQYLQRFPWLTIQKQSVKDGRFNLIVRDTASTPTLLFCGHMDTVQPRSGWITNQLTPVEKAGRIYGLGATDMKGSIASFLSALNDFRATKGLMILLYVDEEYDFLGIRTFIKEYRGKIRPKVILSGDGYNLQLGNGCRGLIEVTCVVKGAAGHASRPQSGKNAIELSMRAIESLKKFLEKNGTDPTLGQTACNLAYIQGGLDLRTTKKSSLRFGREGNNIADIAEFVLDIRPARATLNAQRMITLLKEFIKKEGGVLEQSRVRHDLDAWVTSKKQIRSLERIIRQKNKNPFADPSSYGFIDIQMLWKAFGRVPCVTFGPGEKSRAHKPNEYVAIRSLTRARAVYKTAIKELAKGGEKQ